MDRGPIRRARGGERRLVADQALLLGLGLLLGALACLKVLERLVRVRVRIRVRVRVRLRVRVRVRGRVRVRVRARARLWLGSG